MKIGRIKAQLYRWRGFSIGHNVVFGGHCWIHGDVEIGDYCKFNRNVLLDSYKTAKIVIGRYVIVGANVVIRNANHGYKQIDIPMLLQPKEASDITIGDDVWIGSNVVITAGVTIGEGCMIGAGAVVTRDIPPYSVAMGVPAKVVRQRGENKVISSHDGLFVLKDRTKFKLATEE